MHSHGSRGGILAGAVAGIAAISIGTVATMSFRSTVVESARPNDAAAERMVQPHEVAGVLAEAGLDPQTLAAAGVSGLQCDGIFDAGLTFCIEASRPSQFNIAHKAVNQRMARAVKPSAVVEGPQQTIAQAQASLDNLKASAFQFVTVGLTQAQIAKLTTIKANKHWGLPVEYLVTDRTNQEWLALRGALAAKRAATKRGTTLAPQPAQVITAADANEAVAQAKAALASGLAAVKASWTTHARPAGADANPYQP